MIRSTFIFTSILMICMFSSCGKQQPNTETNRLNLATPGECVQAELTMQERELTLTGKVDYDPDKVVAYTPLISGMVTASRFSLGDKVEKGQVLLEIRSTELNTMRSELITSEAEYHSTRRAYATAQELFEDKMLPEKELAEAEAKLRQAKAEYERTRNDVALFSSGAKDGVFTIKSPISGYIVRKDIVTGSTITAGSEPIFTVADLSTIWVLANVYAGELTYVKEGMEVEVTTLSYKGEVFKGKIDNISQTFDTEERVLKARIKMENNSLKLKPEMSTVVKLKEHIAQELITIPSDALIFDRDRYYVVTKAGEAYAVKEVELYEQQRQISYVASGLQAGDEVVVRNQLLIYSAIKEGEDA